MRSMILSLMLGLGVVGFSLASPAQAKAESPRILISSGRRETQFMHGRGGWGWGHYGRSYQPSWGGYNRGYGYPYGGWNAGYRGYSPPYYGGYSPWGSGAQSFYDLHGFYW